MNPWKLVTIQNGIQVYQNEDTGRIDTIDMYGDDDNS